jgi:hypothetical protein
LAKELENWFQTLKDFMPADALGEGPVSQLAPELAILRLPSDYALETHDRLGLTNLADTEYLLRHAQATDALCSIRQALGLKSFMVRAKHNNANGQAQLLRSNSEIERAEKLVSKWKEVYRRSWQAMGKLRGLGKEDDSGRLKPLLDSDLLMLSDWLDEHRFWQEKGEVAAADAAKKGNGRRDLPWIWKMEFDVTSPISVIDASIQTMSTEGK